MNSTDVVHVDLVDGVRSILGVVEDHAETAGVTLDPEVVESTPVRAAKAWDELTAGYSVDPADVLAKSFDSNGYDELVVKAGIPFFSLCEHHLLPFHGHAHVGYLPQGKIVGLSKLSRLVDVFARRLQVQERLTVEVAEALVTHVSPDVIVVVEAEHLCEQMRGPKTRGVTKTSVVRGRLRDTPEARAEAFALMERKTR